MDEECYEVPVNRVLEACESSFSKGFRVLNQEGILARVQDDIAKFSSVLSLSEEATTRLLCKYGWNIENLCDQWFPDEDKEKVWKFFATYMGLGRKGSMRWCPAGCGRAVEILRGKQTTGGCYCRSVVGPRYDCRWNYTCRFYGDVKKSDELDETEKERERARISLEKYRYCHERWSTHDEWRQIALLDMQELKAVHLKNLSQVQNRSEDNLEFIIDAWDQIVECRRILKWAYVYGYYIPDDDQWKMNFFEYVLDQAEATLKKLHQCAQTELQIYLKVPLEDFDGFRVKLSKLTSVTRKYFDELVGAIENGLLMQIQKVAR
nr:probable E3 ubiquitin-protein ligase ARI8 [Coffea arabica]